jgi:hypothetical protein
MFPGWLQFVAPLANKWSWLKKALEAALEKLYRPTIKPINVGTNFVVEV